MSLFSSQSATARHVLTVYDASAFRCTGGVNRGDALELSDTLCLGDSYRLAVEADALRIELLGAVFLDTIATGYRLANAPEVLVDLGPTLTMMTQAGGLTSMRSLMIDGDSFLLPLGAVDLFSPLTIIAQAPDLAPLPLADPTCLAFTRGTRIAVQDGRLVAIEDLKPADKLLTRAGRAASVRAVLSQTVPAIGRATRVVIREGAFANETELVVAADHRLYVPARRSDLDPDGPDRMEPAIKLVNGLTVTADAGGRTEYFQVLLDQHEVIYAEGIPCESFLLTNASRAGLTDALAVQVAASGVKEAHVPHPASLPPSLRPRPKAPVMAEKRAISPAI
jgi:hypothetical protein